MVDCTCGVYEAWGFNCQGVLEMIVSRSENVVGAKQVLSAESVMVAPSGQAKLAYRGAPITSATFGGRNVKAMVASRVSQWSYEISRAADRLETAVQVDTATHGSDMSASEAAARATGLERGAK